MRYCVHVRPSMVVLVYGSRECRAISTWPHSPASHRPHPRQIPSARIAERYDPFTSVSLGILSSTKKIAAAKTSGHLWHASARCKPVCTLPWRALGPGTRLRHTLWSTETTCRRAAGGGQKQRRERWRFRGREAAHAWALEEVR